MAAHIISLRDYSTPSGLYEIVWDDEAGTVESDDGDLEFIRSVFDAPKPVTVGDTGLAWDLTDPAHDPSQFLAVLWAIDARIVQEPLRSMLPAVFDGVELPPGGTGEVLYDGDAVLV